MSKNRFTDLVCVLITILTLVVTVVFMNGEQIGLVKAESDSAADRDGIFSDRDLDGTWSESSAVQIVLDDLEGLADSGAYELDGDLYIIAKGTYVLTGSLTDYQVIVDAKGAKVQIVLNGVTIQNETLVPIYVKRADKVFLTLGEDSSNLISVETLSTESEELPDAAIYSKSDLSINGSGTLQVSAGGGHGIKTTDDLVITGGTIVVDAEENALLGKDSVRICDGDFTLTAGEDGIKANNDSDEEKGYVTIVNGSFTIAAGNDGIQAETDLEIIDGTYTITTNGGASNGDAHIEEFGGMGRADGMGGFRPGNSGSDGNDGEDGFRRMGGRGRFGQSSDETVDPDWQPEAEEGERPEMPDFGEMPEMDDWPDYDGMPEMGDRPDFDELPEMGEAPDKSEPSNADQASEDRVAENPETEEDLETEEDDSTDLSPSDSHKGIKAGRQITISGGTFQLDCSDDGIHSDGDVTITEGTIRISAGDDGIHADDNVAVSGGTITIPQSYEGVEGKTIEVSDGILDVTSSDDGFNAGGGSTDFMSGFRMGNPFGVQESDENMSGVQETDENTSDTQESDEEVTDETELSLLHITGGTIYVNADGDGLDSNGDLVIDGGEIYVNGPTNSGNGALDSGSESGGELLINGGTVIALGAAGMDEAFSENSTQYSFRVDLDENYQEGDLLTITDSAGQEIFSYTIQKTGNSIVFGSPELKEGETYTITAGSQTAEITLDSISSGKGYEGFGMGRMRR